MLLLLEMTQQLPCKERAAELRRLEPTPIGRQQVHHANREDVGAFGEDLGELGPYETQARRTAMPHSSKKARIWLMMPVRWLTRRSRTRCSACKSS